MAIVKTHHRGVNSKKVVRTIDAFVIDILKDRLYHWGSDYARTEVCRLFKDFMDEGISQGKIQNFKIICDHRNNKPEDFEKGLYFLEIHFQQAHCLNKTRLKYEFGTFVQK